MATQGNPARRGFRPTLFERLRDDAPQLVAEPVALRQWSASELRESVASDLERLLNTRAGLHPARYADYPELGRSVLGYGLGDFVGLSLASPSDRRRICEALERAITLHEPRLHAIRVDLDLAATSVNTLRFRIRALLQVHPAAEPVDFDAVLQPCSLQYSVACGSRGAT